MRHWYGGIATTCRTATDYEESHDTAKNHCSHGRMTPSVTLSRFTSSARRGYTGVRPLLHAPGHVRHRRHAYRDHEGRRGVLRSLIQGRVWFRRRRHRLVTLSTHDGFRHLSRCFHVTHWPVTDGTGSLAISPAFHPIACCRFITVSIRTDCRG